MGPKAAWAEWGEQGFHEPSKLGTISPFIFFFFLVLKALTRGRVQGIAYLVPWMVVGLEVWVCLPSPADQSWRQGPAGWCESRVLCGCKHVPPPSSLCPELPAPQRQLLLKAYFWTLSHHCGLRLMFGFTRRKKGPKWNIPDLFSCQLKPLFPVLPKWELFLAGFSEIQPLLTTLCSSLQKGSWFPEFYVNLGLIVLYFLKSVIWGWENPLDSLLDGAFFGVFFYSFQWALEGDFYKPTNTLLFPGCPPNTFNGYIASQ